MTLTGRGFSMKLAALLVLSAVGLSGCCAPGSPCAKGAPCDRPAPAPVVAPPPAPVAGPCARLYWPTGSASTASIMLEKCAPPTVQVGIPFDFTLKVENLTGQPLKNVVVRDDLPQNFSLSKTAPQADTAGGSLVWRVGDLPAKGVKTMTVSGTATAAGRLQNCMTVSHEIATCYALEAIAPALTLTKTMPQTVLKCDPIPVKLVVTNSGVGTAQNVKIVDEMPDGLMTLDGKKAVEIMVGSLAAGKSMEYTIQAKADRAGTFANRASATGTGGLGANANASVTVLQPKLAITRTGPALRYIGRPIEYNITVSNTGNGEARNTVIEDAIPAGTTAVKMSDNGVIQGSKVVWGVGTLAPGQSKTVNVTFTGGRIGTVVNTAMANAYCADAVTANAQTEIKGIPAILLECIDIDDPVEVGNETTYVITVTNQGSTPGTNIIIKVTLEDSQQYVASTGATESKPDGKVITFAPLPSLAAGAKASWNVRVKALKAGDVRFTIEMNSDQIDRPVKETESTNQYQ